MKTSHIDVFSTNPSKQEDPTPIIQFNINMSQNQTNNSI